MKRTTTGNSSICLGHQDRALTWASPVLQSEPEQLRGHQPAWCKAGPPTVCLGPADGLIPRRSGFSLTAALCSQRRPRERASSTGDALHQQVHEAWEARLVDPADDREEVVV